MDNKYKKLVDTLPKESEDLWFEYNLAVNKIIQENQQLKEQLKGVQEEREYLFNKLSIENKYLQQENKQLKEQRQELRSWLEKLKTMYENEYKDVDTAEHYNSVLSKLNELEEGKDE